MRKLLLHASHIACIYRAGQPDQVQALRDLSLRIYAGDFLAILGPPGAGKSTLLRILGLRQMPTAGRLTYEGRLITEPTPAAPPILLADDPTGGLDTPDQETLLRQLQFQNARGVTIVLATEDPEVAAYATTIYRLDHGIIYLIGG